jgi:type VI secretion system secreted protein Hcp
MKTKQVFVKLVLTLSALALVAALSLNVGAGSLEPAASPAPTMHTLGEVYNRVKQLVPENWASMPSHSQVAGIWATHMTVVANGNSIDGSCEAAGKEDTIVVVGNEHRLYWPIDPQSGLPTGRRIHEPYTILKYKDKSTPLLYKALCQNEQIDPAEIKFYRTGAMGQEEHYFTVTLHNGRIAEIREITPNLESVSFYYETITWTWVPDGIEWMDNWGDPPGG